MRSVLLLLLLLLVACGRSEKTVHVRLDDPGRAGTVLVFVATDCPIANAYAPELERIHADYVQRGIAFRRVYAEQGADEESVARHAREYALTMPALIDADLDLVRRTGARVTPEAVVLAPDGTLVYRGRIDDLYVDFGKRKQVPGRRELREALDALLAGRPVPTPRTVAVGCFLPAER